MQSLKVRTNPASSWTDDRGPRTKTPAPSVHHASGAPARPYAWPLRFSLIKRPCLILASVSRLRPSVALGPVEAPPWSLQRPTGSLAGHWHKAPRRYEPRTEYPASLGRRAMVWDWLSLCSTINDLWGFIIHNFRRCG